MKGLVLFDQFAKGKSQHLKRTNNCVIYTHKINNPTAQN